jgi:hypothetical protein
MCYSAQIQASYHKYVRMFGAHMSIREFVQLYWERAEGSGARIGPMTVGYRLIRGVW